MRRRLFNVLAGVRSASAILATMPFHERRRLRRQAHRQALRHWQSWIGIALDVSGVVTALVAMNLRWFRFAA